MIDAPSSTWFTTAPHWRWYIVLYFFFGGLAAGSYFLAVLIDLFGRREDRPLARLGYYIAFPLVLVCGVLLVLDLGRPLRFWHMLIERNTYGPMFKYWSPMSFGSWILFAFGFFSFVSFLGALAEDDRVRSPALRRLRWPAFRAVRPPSVLGRVVGVLGGIAGYFLAGYTGILLAVTNRPIWSDTPLLGMLFVVSAASTSAALLILLAHRWGWTMPGVAGVECGPGVARTGVERLAECLGSPVAGGDRCGNDRAPRDVLARAPGSADESRDSRRPRPDRRLSPARRHRPVVRGNVR
jgi:formate-dependent nitrite reductase membrane component NrfD